MFPVAHLPSREVGYSPFMLAALIFIQVIYVTMVYGPIAAFLVELFPTKIRFTSMSLPYHIWNGVFGGLVPINGLEMINQTKNNFASLFYPMIVAGICFFVGMLFVRETYQVDIADARTSTAVMHETAAQAVKVATIGK